MSSEEFNNELERSADKASLESVDGINDISDDTLQSEAPETTLNSASQEEQLSDAEEIKTDFTSDNNISVQQTEEITSDPDDSGKMFTVRPVKFQQFEMTEPNRSIKRNLDIMQDVSMHISVELGRTKSTIKEVMDLSAGSIVELDKIAGEQVEIYANNKLIARGEVIVIEDKFGVRVTSTNIPKITQ